MTSNARRIKLRYCRNSFLLRISETAISKGNPPLRDVAATRSRQRLVRRDSRTATSSLAYPYFLERNAADEVFGISDGPMMQPELRVGFVLWPEFTLLALAGFIDALRLAADVGDRSNKVHCSWAVMSPDATPIRSSCGLSINPDSALSNPTDFDYIVVVGGLIRGFTAARPQLQDYLRTAAKAGVPLVGVCTGAIVLAECGLMKNRKCCVLRYHHNDLVTRAPDAIPVSDQIFIDDGDRISCAGGASTIDLATYLVQRHCGKNRATKLVHAMLLDAARAPAHAQRRLAINDLNVTDVRVGRALRVMEQHIRDPLSMSLLADQLNVSHRQLQRLFDLAFGRSPTEIFRHMRVRHARCLLENSTLTIKEIAFECGFSDSSHFIRSFVEEICCTPGEFRSHLQQSKQSQLSTGTA